MVSKEELKGLFSKEWKKHYRVDFLVQKGFERAQCRSCRKFFWTLDGERKTCADAGCMGYQFIGQPTTRLGYVETWKEIERYFQKKGHTSIKRFPVVSRWRDDLYFTNASIIDFQPYVVTGEVEPPANPLIVPQHCLRFTDLGNVGVTGRHYTGFVMFGQHAFNTPKTKLFYWKDQALEHDYNYVTKILGVKPLDVVFQEEVWAGGGTFGPCIEYFAKGLELGNCVFTQFKEKENGGFEELKTKVIDMGAGLERLAWYTQGTPTSYDVTFAPLVKELKREMGIALDEELFAQYARMSGVLNVEEQDIKEKRAEVAHALNIKEHELFDQLKPLQGLYATLDHLKTILYTTTDGQLPSNAGGGYNLRLILRRVFGFAEELNVQWDYARILNAHARMLKGFDDSVKEGVSTAIDVVHEEEKKYKALKETGRKKMQVLVDKLKKEGKPLQKPELLTLYESHGVPYEVAVEIAYTQGVKAEEVFNFYELVAQKNEKRKERGNVLGKSLSTAYTSTRALYYERLYDDDFTAKVLGVEGSFVVLDQTLFYPTGGGQEFDEGQLNGVPVMEVEKVQGVVLHSVKNPEKFKKGMKVFGRINRERRANLMHNHTCTHLLNACARELLGMHVWQAGAHKDSEKAHIDLTHYRKITPEQVRTLELMVNKRVQDMIPVRKFVLGRTEAEQKYGFRIYQGGFVPGKELRLVEIKGVDIQACGGTHIDNTGEIGFFKILKVESVQDGIERITFTTGLNAVRFTQEEEGMLFKAIDGLKTTKQDFLNAVDKLKTQAERLREREKEVQKAHVSELDQILARKARNGLVMDSFEDLDIKTVMALAQKIVNAHPELAAVLASKPSRQLVILCGKKSAKSARELLSKALSTKAGTGGGSEVIAQARIDDFEKLEAALKSL